MTAASSFAAAKQLRVTLILAQQGNVFPGTGSNTLVLTGLRMVAVVQAVVRSANQLDLSIFGMKQADMNALTVIFFGALPNAFANNIVRLEANGGNGWQIVFEGTILEASPDYQNAPDVSFHIQGRFGYLAGITPGTPLSYANGVSVANAVQTVATAMGFGFQNSGVTTTLPAGSYFPGSLWSQLEAICGNGDVDFYTDNQSQPTIVICPKNTPRQNLPTVQLTPQSGLIGYPRIERSGIAFECLFDPGIIAAGLVQISGSDVPAANGLWIPYKITHQLEAVKPGGAWLSSIHGLWQQAA